MQEGSLVECVTDYFEEFRQIYKLDYPRKHEILTVNAVSPAPPEATKQYPNVVMLQFEEKPDLPPLSSINFDDGTENFKELLAGITMEKIEEELYETV